eukprot:1145228-Pelagomonas_calceolata.AAC.2
MGVLGSFAMTGSAWACGSKPNIQVRVSFVQMSQASSACCAALSRQASPRGNTIQLGKPTRA